MIFNKDLPNLTKLRQIGADNRLYVTTEFFLRILWNWINPARPFVIYDLILRILTNDVINVINTTDIQTLTDVFSILC